MSLPSQFSLSLELTKIVPFGSALEAAGSGILRLVRELHKSGSDALVEEDLAHIFGRNRIEARFASGFRTVVKESSSEPLGAFLDIVLESGAGPTVRRSLTNDPGDTYFSTVVQLSLLTSMLDLHGLTAGLRHALARRAQAISADQSDTPSFDNLLGTLRAIRDQTSAFNWNLLLEAVNPPGFGRNSSSTDYYCPAVILQGCLDMFAIVQHFPDDRVVQIKVLTRTGEALGELLVVWAHHILGLNVSWCDESGRALGRFGTGRENIVIVVDDSMDSDSVPEICLLDGSGEQIFRLTESDDDPAIEADVRFAAEGFGKRYLEYYGSHHLAEDILRGSIEHCQSWLSKQYDTSASNYPSERLHKAAVFLFQDLFEPTFLEPYQGPESQLRDNIDKKVAVPLAKTLYAFFHVDQIENLDELHNLPLSAKAVEDLSIDSSHDDRKPFRYMTQLLARNVDTSNAVLVSSRGWSVYTNILVLPDPTEVSNRVVYVAHGVPSRGGERKQCIRDAVVPQSRLRTLDKCDQPNTSAPTKLRCAFDVTKPRWFVGSTSSAFELFVIFELGPSNQAKNIRRFYKSGLLRLEEIACSITFLLECDHPEVAHGSEITIPPGCQTFSSSCDFVFAKTDPKPIFVALSAGSPHARWFCLLHAASEEGASGFGSRRQTRRLALRHVYVRDRNMCPDCSIKTAKDAISQNSAEVVPDVAVVIL